MLSCIQESLETQSQKAVVMLGKSIFRFILPDVSIDRLILVAVTEVTL